MYKNEATSSLEIPPSSKTFVKEMPFKVFNLVYNSPTTPSIIATLVHQKDSPPLSYVSPLPPRSLLAPPFY